MTGFGQQHDIGAFIKPEIGTKPEASTGGAVNGASIDRQGFESCVLAAHSGAVTGGPSAQTVDSKLQDSPDGSTGWVDITGAAITQITAVDTIERKNVDLAAVKRFIRVVTTVGFTGGTSPDLGVAAVVLLGGATELPTA